MSHYIRPRIAGASLFFTVALAHRGTTLLVDHVDILRNAVAEARRDRPFEINAWVVMPDHFHAVWTLPEGDSAYAVRMSAIKARFSRDLRRAGVRPPPGLPVVVSGRYAGLKPDLRKDRREAGIWQRRFWEHHCRGAEDVAACVRYCHLNPVKHGFVARAEEWRWSSLRREVQAGRWVA